MTHDDHSSHDNAHGDHTEGGSVLVWLEIAAIALLAGFLVLSFGTDRLRFFVARGYVWLSPAAAAALLAMVAVRLHAQVRGHGRCACQDGGGLARRVLCVALIVGPVGIALAVSPDRFSPEGLRKRRTPPAPRDRQLDRAIAWVLGGKSATGSSTQAAAALPKDPTILDVLTAIEQGDPAGLDGRFVSVLGQCDLPGGEASPRFDLYRLLVTCCVADASAVSIEVVRKANVKLEPGGWVRVRGRIRFDDPGGAAVPVVHAVAIEKVPEPADPYL